MKITDKRAVKVGEAAMTYIKNKDANAKSTRSTTAGITEGKLTFPKDSNKWEIFVATYTARNGELRDYPCIICKDSEGEEHAIALTAFREKDPVVTLDGKTLSCPNLCEFDADYNTIWETLKANKDRISLHRVVGRRNNFKGRYEYFTLD